MHWQDSAPPPSEHHHLSAFLIDLNRGVTKLSHALGEIRGTVRAIETEVREVRSVQAKIKDRVHLIETAVQAKPSTLDRAAKLAPAIKEAWPFLAFAAAAIAKALGYDFGDLHGIAGP